MHAPAPAIKPRPPPPNWIKGSISTACGPAIKPWTVVTPSPAHAAFGPGTLHAAAPTHLVRTCAPVLLARTELHPFPARVRSFPLCLLKLPTWPPPRRAPQPGWVTTPCVRKCSLSSTTRWRCKLKRPCWSPTTWCLGSTAAARASTNEVAAAIAGEIGALASDIIVVLHFPEKFLVCLVYKHHAEIASACREVPYGDTKLQLRARRLEEHAKNVDLRRHVRLCAEGLPLYAWDDHAGANTIGSGYSLDYIEPASKLKTETKVLALWAWTPCLNWITFPARNGGAPTYGRRGLKHRVLVHLDIHEDPSFGRVVSKPNDWRSNIIDGEKEACDRRERISRPVRQDRRDKDVEGDRDRGRRRDGSRDGDGWAANLRWSLSRASREDQRDSGHEDRNGRRGDRDSCDGRCRDLLPCPYCSARGIRFCKFPRCSC
ncbi:hypothetical protein ZWY2020_013104 [Hordeum vulgare]|nr:hypothetical protein ZWY2020_013104 [Hordeum vulgare]